MPFLGKRILIVTAHPDDESFLAAGTMLKNVEAGGTNFVFCATLGERGKAHVRTSCTAAQLKRMRKSELLNVSRFLGAAKTAFGNIPDGCVSCRNHAKEFRAKLASFAAQVKPDIIMGFGKDGISGHKDHLTACAVAKSLAKKLRLPYLAFCMPPRLQQYHEWLKNRRKNGVYIDNHQPLESPDVVFQIDGEKKLKVLRMHKSQMKNGDPFWGLPKSVAKAHLRAEYFAYQPWRAKRPRRPGAHR